LREIPFGSGLSGLGGPVENLRAHDNIPERGEEPFVLPARPHGDPHKAAVQVRKGRAVADENASLPEGLRQAERLPEPIFTPTTKAPKGQHDEPINDAQGEELVGADLYRHAQSASLSLYKLGHERASKAGMILADTKFEFGTDGDGRLVLIDEILTPDSSRYWPKDRYGINQSPPSYDKQFVRDHLLAIKWDQKPPAPALPAEVIRVTEEKYLTALRNLLG